MVQPGSSSEETNFSNIANHQRHVRLIRITINDKWTADPKYNIMARIDTGSNVSVLPLCLLKTIHEKVLPTTQIYDYVEGITGHLTPVLTQVVVPVCLGVANAMVSMLVCDVPIMYAILGWDIIEHFGDVRFSIKNTTISGRDGMEGAKVYIGRRPRKIYLLSPETMRTYYLQYIIAANPEEMPQMATRLRIRLEPIQYAFEKDIPNLNTGNTSLGHNPNSIVSEYPNVVPTYRVNMGRRRATVAAGQLEDNDHQDPLDVFPREPIIPVVRATINGINVACLVDTGASLSILPPEFACFCE